MAKAIKALEAKLSLLESKFGARESSALSACAADVNVSSTTQETHTVAGLRTSEHVPVPPPLLPVVQNNTLSYSILNSKNADFLSAPSAPKSTWEANKCAAILLLEQQVKSLSSTQHQGQENTAPGYPLAQDHPVGYLLESSSSPRREILMTQGIGGNVFQSLHIPQHQVHVWPGHHHAGASVVTGAKNNQHTKLPPQMDKAVVDIIQGPSSVAKFRNSDANSAGRGKSSAWEHQQARALLSLEREKDGLQEQLAQYAFLEAKHKKHLVQVHSRHAQALEDAQGNAGRKLSTLYESAAAALAQQRDRYRLLRAMTAWRREARQTSRLYWALHVWNMRILQDVLTAWYDITQEARHPEAVKQRQIEVLHAWHLQASASARHKRIAQRCHHLHVSNVLHAWHWAAQYCAAKRSACQMGVRHYQNSLMFKTLYSLKQGVEFSQAAIKLIRHRSACIMKLAVLQVLHGEVQQRHRITVLTNRNRQRRYLLAWHSTTLYKQRLYRVMDRHRTAYQQRLLHSIMTFWNAWSQYKDHLCTCEKQLSSRTRIRTMLRVLRRLYQGAGIQHLERRIARRILGSCIQSWLSHVRRHTRNDRVAASAAAQRLWRIGKAVIMTWRSMAMKRRFRSQEEDMSKLQVLVSQLQVGAAEAMSDRHAAMTRAEALQVRADVLEREAGRQMYMAGPSHLVGLRPNWRLMSPHPSATSITPRMKHHTFHLPSLQSDLFNGQDTHPAAATTTLQQAGSSTWAASQASLTGHSQHEDVISQEVLIVFGGVTGDLWLKDIQAVTLTHTHEGMRMSVSGVPLDMSGCGPAGFPPLSGCAACQDGPSSFAVIGGFDGAKETCDVYLIKVQQQSPAASVVGGVDLAAAAQLIPARQGQVPPGRTHATACCYSHGRMLLLFGGYSSSQGGCLNDLWAFNMDTLAWWQPDVAGDWPEHRRGHISVVIGDYLYVHGGYDVDIHYQDLWRCDLKTWEWHCLEQQGAIPSCRRGHACCVIDDRYVMISGGYDGTRHLSDLHVLDTHSLTWQPMHASGDAPIPCAMHTLTACKGRCVLLGGSGVLGALPDTYLLEPPGLEAAQQLQADLFMTTQRLAGLSCVVGELEAALQEAQWKLQEAQSRVQVMEVRCAEVAAQQQAAISDVQALQAAVTEHEVAANAARARADAAEAKAAAADRKLARARKGGKQVTEAAQYLQDRLAAAEQQLEEFNMRWEDSQRHLAACQEQAAQASAQNQLLHVQLATANNEISILRALTPTQLATTAANARRMSRQQRQQRKISRTPPAAVTSSSSPEQENSYSDDFESEGSSCDPNHDDIDGDVGAAAGSETQQGHNHHHHKLRRHVDVSRAVVANKDGLERAATAAQQQAQLLQDRLVQQDQAWAAQVNHERVRAAAAEQRLMAMETKATELKAQVSVLQQQHDKEVSSRRGAEETARQAVAQLRHVQVVHDQETARLRQQLAGAQAARWHDDMRQPQHGQHGQQHGSPSGADVRRSYVSNTAVEALRQHVRGT